MNVFEFNGFRFVQKHEEGPEVYDVFEAENGKLTGYVRLGEGELVCRCPDIYGDIVFNHNFNGIHMESFSDYEDRTIYLKSISNNIARWLRKGRAYKLKDDPKLVSAKCAYDMTKKVREDMATEQLKEIAVLIIDAIENGMFYTTTTKELMTETIEALSELGYKIITDSADYHDINWSNEESKQE